MNFKKIAAVTVVVLFTTLAIHNLVDNQNQLHIQKLQVKSKNTELKTLELKYDNLQIELNKTDKNNQEQIKKLQEEKDKLEQERLRLEKELAVKRASKLQIASQSIPTSGTASAASGGSVEAMVRAAAVKYGVNPDYLARVARCESGFNPNSINYNYYAGGGHPSGVFQFIPSTWARMSTQAGFAGASVFDAYSNVNVAAWAFANGRASEWACS